jgi:hypothetical protein
VIPPSVQFSADWIPAPIFLLQPPESTNKRVFGVFLFLFCFPLFLESAIRRRAVLSNWRRLLEGSFCFSLSLPYPAHAAMHAIGRVRNRRVPKGL